MFPKLLIAGHLLCLKIYEVRQSKRDQSFLLLRTESGQSFLLMLDKSSTLNIFKAWEERERVSLPLFISILRSSACHYQPQQFSDWVGQETPGLLVAGRQGGISVNPPYSLLWEDDTHEAAHLMIISHNWAKELLVVRLPGERSSCLCCAILTDTDEKSSHHSQCCCHTQDCKDTTTTTNYGTVLSPKIFAGTRQFPG